MTRLSLLRTDDFTGGLNLRADPFQLGRTESPDLLNVDIDPRGGLTVRGGMTKLNTSAISSIANGSFTPKALYAWDNVTPQVLLSANNNVYSATTTAFTNLSEAGVAISTVSYNGGLNTTNYFTSTAHGFSNGDTVTITGVTPTNFNITTVISVASSTHFYIVGGLGASSGTGGTVRRLVKTTAPFGASFTSWSASSESFAYVATGGNSFKWAGTTATLLNDASADYADD